MNEETRKKILGQIQHRTITLDRATIDKDNRTVPVAFSSETPVERWYGYEILDHKPGSCRMGRLMDGAPCLVQHDPEDHIGVVESPMMGEDRIGRCNIRFSKSENADAIFQDVLDGIRSKISVGYMVHAMVLEKKEGDTEYYRITDWEPYEISLVSIPADNSVGVGRSANPTDVQEMIEKEVEKRLNTITIPNGGRPTMDPNNPTTPTTEETLASERTRVEQIDAWSKRFIGRVSNIVELRTAAIKEGTSVELFKGQVADRLVDSQPFTTDDEIGLSQNQIKEYSIARAIQHQLLQKTGEKRLLNGDTLDATFEIECSNAVAKRMGIAPQGLLVPMDVRRYGSVQVPIAVQRQLARMLGMNGIMSRDLVVGTPTAGGNLVGTNLLAGSFIELLRNRMLATRLGVQTLDGLVGNIAFPKQTGAGTAYYVAENVAPASESALTVGQVTASPKDVGAYMDYARRLLLQSTPSIDGMVTNDLIAIIALAKDKGVFHGSGGTQPTGIAGTNGVGSVSAAGVSWASIVEFETDVATANADVNNMSYVTDPTGYGLLKTTQKEAGYPVYLLGENAQMNGYSAFRTNQITSGYLFFGDFGQAMLCNWGTLDILVDTSTGSIAGTVRVVAFSSYDVAVRQAGAFSVASDLS